ncbi:MAG: PKD domain-containing protein, partial [Thermoplasmata archaeon]|nr:PKD domain-containing protein [Thermoplasmata archaeon]
PQGAYQEDFSGELDGVVCKLDAGGKTLEASTYFGAEYDVAFYALALDAEDNVFVTGYTDSEFFNVTTGAYQTTLGGDFDAFVTTFDPDVTTLVRSTYIGGDSEDTGYDIQVDEGGAAYITGYTYGNFPITKDAYQTTMKPVMYQTAVFVTKLAFDGASLVYSTYLDGFQDDDAYALAIDDTDNAHVVGTTYSADFPVTTGTLSTTMQGLGDAFVSRLDATGSNLVSSTFLGGNDFEYGTDIFLDEEGSILISGATGSINFPVTAGAAQSKFKDGFTDAFFSKLSANYSSLEYSSYLGGTGGDEATCVASNDSLYATVAGVTGSTDFPTTNGAFQTRQGGGAFDCYITNFIFDLERPVVVLGPDIVVDQHEWVEFNGSASTDDVGIVNWTWSFQYGLADVELHGPVASFLFDDAGFYPVELEVRDRARHRVRGTMNVTVRDTTPPDVDAGATRYIDQGATVFFEPSGTDNVGIINWSWSIAYGDIGVILYGPSPNFTFGDAGDFNVSLYVTDAAGLRASDWLWVHVRDV